MRRSPRRSVRYSHLSTSEDPHRYAGLRPYGSRHRRPAAIGRPAAALRHSGDESGQQSAQHLALIGRQWSQDLLCGRPARVAQRPERGTALVGELDPDHPAAVRIRGAAHPAARLQRVDQARHGARHDIQALREIRHPGRSVVVGDRAQQPELGRGDADRLQLAASGCGAAGGSAAAAARPAGRRSRGSPYGNNIRTPFIVSIGNNELCSQKFDCCPRPSPSVTPVEGAHETRRTHVDAPAQGRHAAARRAAPHLPPLPPVPRPAHAGRTARRRLVAGLGGLAVPAARDSRHRHPAGPYGTAVAARPRHDPHRRR